MVGAEFDTQHGLTNAIVLPAVLRFNKKMISHKVPIMCQAMNLKQNDFDYFYQSICELLDQLGIPKNLKEIGIDESSLNSLAEKALKDSAFATNPKTASLEEMEEIIYQSLNPGR